MSHLFRPVFQTLPISGVVPSRLRSMAWKLALLLVMLSALTPAVARANDEMHVVSHGERLADIARIYDVGLAELIAVNAINDPSLIAPGQRLIIPGTKLANPYGAPADSELLPARDGYYTVKQGDSLLVIARNHGMALADVMRLNGIAHRNHIVIGQELRVTARVAPVYVEAAAKPQPANAIHIVDDGDSLAQIARDYGTTLEELLVANGLPNTNFVFAGQQLRVPASSGEVDALAVAGTPADGARRIEVDLSAQTLSAYQGDVRVMHTSVSTGKSNTPTVVGTFEVGTKYEKQHMWGDDYDLPNVPWVMYFQGAYAIHGAYWHTNFGTPASHGCVNMRPEEAEILFSWAPAGTKVIVTQ